MDKNKNAIFKNGSRTYYYSSLFFPNHVKKDVFDLYAFVRVADDFVDQIPSNKKNFDDFVQQYNESNRENPIIKGLLDLEKRQIVQKDEIKAFLSAMESDIPEHIEYKTYQDLQKYMYGSAEVIGLFMARILNLNAASFPYAQKLGEAMQYINFIRDIDEDLNMNRMYIPKEILSKYHIKSLKEIKHTKSQKEITQFCKMIRQEIKRYYALQKEAEKGFWYISYRYLIPIKTASDMYKWTAHQIFKNPRIVFEKKIKPSKLRLLFTILKNSIVLLWAYGGIFRKK